MIDVIKKIVDVEVVAIKCQSQPRPLSVKAQRFRNPLLGNKDTLMYTRMQLAERLRNAWSEREKIKPNLNIFLAHASNTTRSDSASIDGNQENASTLSDPLEKKRKPLQMRAFSQDYCPPELFQDKLKVPPFGLKLQGNYFKQENDDVPSLSESIDSTANDENKSTEETHCLQEFNKIEIRVTKNEDTHSSNFCLHKENMEANHACEPNGDNQSEKTVKTVMTAEVRRAKFRSSSILNKTITESFSSSLTNEEEKFCEENDDVKKSNSKKVLIRALSAPSHDQHYQKENFPQKAVKFQPPIAKRLQGAVASDASGKYIT